MPHWNPDLYNRAWFFATKAHEGQTYGGAQEGERIPYINHIGSVAMEVMWAFHAENSNNLFDNNLDFNLAIQCALLHDTIEDTHITYQDICDNFGKKIADGVLALSKNPALPKAEQMQDSLDRICAQPREIALVKLADRISNLKAPPFYWDKQKGLDYQFESTIILEKLGFASEVLAQRLQIKIDNYLDFWEKE